MLFLSALAEISNQTHVFSAEDARLSLDNCLLLCVRHQAQEGELQAEQKVQGRRLLHWCEKV